MAKLIFGFVALITTQAAFAAAATIGMPCSDSGVQTQRSAELEEILKADQADRSFQLEGKQPTQLLLEKMAANDLKRRMRIGEIFGEGCLKSKSDYKAAFFVYQHGNTSGQYFQAYLWAKQVLELGDANMKSEMAMSIDRYLVSVGNKQLFGTQATQATIGGCWCIQPTEASFPKSLREQYRGGGNAAYTGLPYLKTLNKGLNCSTSYCDSKLAPTPHGAVPGFW